MEDWTRWLQLFGTPGVALICGAISRLYSIDCDGDGAIAYLASLDLLPDGPCVLTPRGLRWIVRRGDHPLKTWTLSGAGWSLTFLGEGALSLLPPSIHPCGRPYLWCSGLSPEEISPGGIPAGLLNLMARRESPSPRIHPIKGPRTSLAPRPPPVDGMIPEGVRNSTLFREACRWIRQGMPPDCVRASLKDLNARCLPSLTESELERIYSSVCRYQDSPP